MTVTTWSSARSTAWNANCLALLAAAVTLGGCAEAPQPSAGYPAAPVQHFAGPRPAAIDACAARLRRPSSERVGSEPACPNASADELVAAGVRVGMEAVARDRREVEVAEQKRRQREAALGPALNAAVNAWLGCVRHAVGIFALQPEPAENVVEAAFGACLAEEETATARQAEVINRPADEIVRIVKDKLHSTILADVLALRAIARPSVAPAVNPPGASKL